MVIWGLSLLLWGTGQAQEKGLTAELDSASTLLAAHQYTAVVELLQGYQGADPGRADQLLGWSYLYLDEYDRAIQHANRAIAQGCLTGYMLKGDAWMLAEQLDSALVAYDRVIQLFPDNPVGFWKRATIYADEKQWELSDRDYRGALACDSTYLLGWLGLANNAYARGRYDEGLALLKPLDDLAGDYSDFYLLRAGLAMNANELEQAMDDLVRCLHLGTVEGFSMLYTIGNLDTDLVMRKVSEAAVRYPTEFIWPYSVGMLHMVAYRYPEAIASLQEANRLSPRSFINEQIAKCYEVLGRYAEGVTAIDEAIRLDPNDLRYYKQRMQLLAYSGQVDKAIRQGESYLNSQPDDVNTYNFLGYLCYWKRDWESAAQYLSMGIALDRSFAPMYVLRGMVMQAKGDGAAAQADFEAALVRYGEGGTIASQYHAYAGLGRFDEGVTALERYLTTESNEADAYYDGACFYARAGQTDKAIAYLEQAIRQGFCQCALLIYDPDLDSVRQQVRFGELLQQLKTTYHYSD